MDEPPSENWLGKVNEVREEANIAQKEASALYLVIASIANAVGDKVTLFETMSARSELIKDWIELMQKRGWFLMDIGFDGGFLFDFDKI